MRPARCRGDVGIDVGMEGERSESKRRRTATLPERTGQQGRRTQNEKTSRDGML